MPSKAQLKGYQSNKKARNWLLDNGFTYVWLHPHPRHADRLYVDKTNIVYTRDLFNLFDGIALLDGGLPVFIQIKTNSWNGWKNIMEFIQHKSIYVIFINVKKGKVLFRTNMEWLE